MTKLRTMSRLKLRKKKLDKARYNLHYRLKEKHPDDANLLDPVHRTFREKPNSPAALKLVREFGYKVMIPAFNPDDFNAKTASHAYD